MKKSEAIRIIKEEVQKIREEQGARIPLKDLTYDNVDQVSVKKLTGKTLVPQSPGSYMIVHSREQFDDWKKSFADIYGLEGDVVRGEFNSGWYKLSVEGNPRWDS